MIQSIIDDIKGQMRYGNMITKIIMINFFVFFAMILVKAFTPGGGTSASFQTVLSWFAISDDPLDLFRHPLSAFSHMFLHIGFWHIAWNMLMLYWFGRIVGDLVGDKRVLPIYILGGLAGALAFLIFANFTGGPSLAYGASAAVMAMVVAAGFLAPEYNMRLLLIGDVKLKYVALALVLIDLVMITESNNTGGRFAHLGGAIFGGVYVYLLGAGKDIAAPVTEFTERMTKQTKKYKTPMTVVHNKMNQPTGDSTAANIDFQERVDEILDKINQTGFESLNEEEKEFLYQASKK